MATQQPRLPWFRFSRTATAAHPRPLASHAVRPSIPIRPTQAQEPVPPQQSLASPPPAPQRSTVGAPAPQPSLPRTPAAMPPPPPANPPRTPAPQPTQPSPPLAPTPALKSPVQEQRLTTSIYAPTSSSSAHTPPQTKSQPPSSSTRTSPVPKPAAAAVTSEAVNGKASNPLSSPKMIKPLERTQAESPRLRPLSRPPSPLALPPAQINSHGERDPMIERKTMLEHQTIDKPVKVPRAHNNGIASNGKKEPASKDKGLSQKLSDSEELGIRVVALAGENKGAAMELSPFHKKNYAVGNPRNLQKNGTDQSSNKSGEEDKSRNYYDKAKGGKTMQHPMTYYFNSNVQGLNNSIVYNCTHQHNNPGIHLSLRRANRCHSKK